MNPLDKTVLPQVPPPPPPRGVPDVPNREQIIRADALNFAINARSWSPEGDATDAILATAARFEAYIRDGAA